MRLAQAARCRLYAVRGEWPITHYANEPTQEIIGTVADVLIRVKEDRKLPVCRRLSDGSYLSHIGSARVRVINAQITITTDDGRRTASYRLITTVLEQACPPEEIVRLYHDRWEIETAYCELKATILGGRVLRARTPTGLDQEIYALLTTHQAIRIAIADGTLTQPATDPDRPATPELAHD